MTDILEKLNLAADNNRVFSVSDETQELLRKFKLIFKDLINGVPTAYHDLEMLLTNGNRQLQDTYTKLPSFLQKLIEKLPEKWTESLAPEMLAVASERATQNGINIEHVGKAAAAAEKIGIPSLKELVSKPAAILGMLRSIMTFLRARFPAAMGMNILWSLALFSMWNQVKNPATYLCTLTQIYSPTIRLVVLPQAWARGASRKRAPGDRGRDQEAQRERLGISNPSHRDLDDDCAAGRLGR